MNLAVFEVLIQALEQVLLCVLLELRLKNSRKIFVPQGNFVELHFLYNSYSLLLAILSLINSHVAFVYFLV